MSVHVAGEISRFFGYLHLSNTLNLDALHYSGAPVYVPPGFVPDGVARSAVNPIALPQATNALRLPTEDEVDQPAASPRPLLAGLELPAIALTLPLLPAAQPLPVPTLSFAEPIVAFGQLPPIDPTVTYAIGQTAGSAFWLTQRNDLGDDDVVVDRLVAVDDLPLPPDVATAIDALIAQALALVPDGLGPRTGAIGGLEQEHHAGGDEAEILPPAGTIAAPPASAVVADGTHVNGNMISSAGATQGQQVADLQEAIDSILGEGKIGAPRSTVHAPAPADTQGQPSAFGPTGGAAQIVSAGGNEAANVAAVYDLGDTFGSRIILGDYYEKNVIVQVNVLSSPGSPLPTPADIVSAVMPGASNLTSEASFRSDPGLLYGSMAKGYPGATKWKVDYVDGDFIDITTLIQRNVLYDNDVAAPAQTLSHSVATLGENDQINVLNLIELGKSYDLIIIAGDYVKYNAIFQFNIVLDDDGAAHAGGNTLLNDAAIIGSGGSSHTPITANAAALADAVANQSPVIDHAWTIGLPGNGNDTLEILYVTGDYYSYNILVQANIVSDVDAITPADAAASDTLQQASYSGANTGSNLALIYDADSQSAYQMLAGEAYEDNFLVQANLILDADNDDETADDDDTDHSLIGVIAALDMDDQSHSGRGDADADGGATGGIDVLGSLLH